MRYRVTQLGSLSIFRVEWWREPRWYRQGKWVPVTETRSGYDDWWEVPVEFTTREGAIASMHECIAADRERETRKRGDWR